MEFDERHARLSQQRNSSVIVYYQMYDLLFRALSQIPSLLTAVIRRFMQIPRTLQLCEAAEVS